MEELFGGSFDDVSGVLGRLHITAVEGLVFINDEGDESAKITVFDTWYECVVLAEGSG